MEGFSFQKWKYLPPYIPHCRARSQYPPYSFSCLVYQGKQAESQVRSWLLSKDSASPSYERFLQAKESPINPLSWLGTAIVGPRLGSAQDQANGRRTGRSCLVGLHGCSQVLTKHNPTGNHHCIAATIMNIARKCSRICFEQSCLAWHLSWFIVYWYGLRLVSWAVAVGYFSRLSSRSCSTWLTLSSTWSILLQPSRRWSLQAWNWWAIRQNTTCHF